MTDGGLLGLAAQGAYQQLLWTCYNDGSIPSDESELASICSCTPEIMNQLWPMFSHKFSRHPKMKNLLVNREVSMRRREFERTHSMKSVAGIKSGLSRATAKVSSSNGIMNTRSNKNEHHTNTRSIENEHQLPTRALKRKAKPNQDKDKPSVVVDARASPKNKFPANQIEIVRRSLEAYMAGTDLGSPDMQIVLETLEAAHGASAEQINEFLVEKFRSSPPTKSNGPKSFGFFPVIVRGRFSHGD